MIAELKQRIRFALLILAGKDPFFALNNELRRRARAYEAVAITAFETLEHMSRMPHNGKKARSAMLFIQTQAKDSGLNLYGF